MYSSWEHTHNINCRLTLQNVKLWIVTCIGWAVNPEWNVEGTKIVTFDTRFLDRISFVELNKKNLLDLVRVYDHTDNYTWQVDLRDRDKNDYILHYWLCTETLN